MGKFKDTINVINNQLQESYNLGNGLNANDWVTIAAEYGTDADESDYVSAEYTGEFRTPNIGEWYMNGTGDQRVAVRCENGVRGKMNIVKLTYRTDT
jgi:hypothetical protein